ncbi:MULTISPECIES: hypothetical protein [Kaistia]|uniref:Uncharacterized protein n=1 Tax=Kaistia nematophila TaxID=2994654 RepID=A0A9X3DZ87_9HYPH|nr:hypothetical protein [Kaistia nematophila]MBN9026829.1 hypothetical protein [Hyphomicrobiales bacterium]MBN9060101.1 hypothetical protein [Hyphomicrobiales bacterium]MCX5568349.1 hypothetical protein [Kaistia nematophila]
MAKLYTRTTISLVATAAIVAFGVTAYGGQAMSRTSGASDPTALTLFDKAAVGGRKGCEVQSWPDIAPECLQPSDGQALAKPARKV